MVLRVERVVEEYANACDLILVSGIVSDDEFLGCGGGLGLLGWGSGCSKWGAYPSDADVSWGGYPSYLVLDVVSGSLCYVTFVIIV